jgi:hypothetical protein
LIVFTNIAKEKIVIFISSISSWVIPLYFLDLIN